MSKDCKAKGKYVHANTSVWCPAYDLYFQLMIFFSCPNLSGRHENVPLSFLLACFRFSNSEYAALSCSPLSHSLFARESRLSLAILCMQLTSAAAESWLADHWNFYWKTCPNIPVYLFLAWSIFRAHKLLWDYSVDSYSGIRIIEHTEYQFPKEQTFCANRIADVTKIKATRPRKFGSVRNILAERQTKIAKQHDHRLFCVFRTNRYSVNSAIGSETDRILFRSFRNQKRSQKNTVTVYSVYSHSRIVPKERALSIWAHICLFDCLV